MVGLIRFRTKRDIGVKLAFDLFHKDIFPLNQVTIFLALASSCTTVVFMLSPA